MIPGPLGRWWSAATGTAPRKGFLAIVGGTGAGQFVALLALPILTRVYEPREMALYGVVIGMSALIASFASLRLELAIPLPDEPRESRALLWICIASTLVLSGLFGVVAFAWPALPAAIWPEARSGAWVLPTVIMVVLISAYAALTQMSIRLRRYGVIGRVTFIQQVVTVGAQLGASVTIPAGGLTWGAILGRATGIVTLARATGLRLADWPHPRAVLAILRRYWRFPLVFAPTAVVNVLGIQLAMLTFPALFGVTAAGLYALAVRVVSVPESLVGGAAKQVYVGELARTPSGKASEALFLKWTKVLVVVGVLTGLGSWFLVAPLVEVLFGGSWAAAAPYIQYLGLMAAFAVVGSPLQGTWIVYQSGTSTLAWSIARLASIGLVLTVAAGRGTSPTLAVALLAISGALTYTCGWVACWWQVRSGSRPQGSEGGHAAGSEVAGE